MSQSYTIDELEPWVTFDEMERMREVDSDQAESLASNPENVRKVLSFGVEGRGDSYVRGDSLQTGELPDRFSVAPDVDITVYRRDHPRYDYLMLFKVGREAFKAITFTGSLIEVLQHSLVQLDDGIDGIRNIYNIDCPDPEHNEERDFIEDVEMELRSKKLRESLESVREK